MWIAGTIHKNAYGETFSVLTAPTDERHSPISPQEPILIGTGHLHDWMNVTKDPTLMLRAPSVMALTNPLIQSR